MSAWPHPTSPYHAGEMAMQTRAGVREVAERAGRQVFRDFMPDQHRAFFALLPYLAFATLDQRGRPWAGMFSGSPGFATSPDPRRLDIRARPISGDPAGEGLKTGASIGLVGVELHTRRRNRMNGRIVKADDSGISIAVGQSFGNCPQYIQARRPAEPADGPVSTARRQRARLLAELSDNISGIITKADTCFIASASPGAGSEDAVEGADINHRGGRPGFLRLSREGERTIVTLPDFVGNLFFNTLGNIHSNPVAGLLVPDFTTGNAISMTGSAEVIWEGAELANFQGAERLVRITIEEAFLLEGLLPSVWSEATLASQLKDTGTWEEAGQGIAASTATIAPRAFRVVAVTEETAGVRSFELVPEDGAPPLPHRPGQFLPLILDRGEGRAPLRAVYSLSREQNGASYRISVRRADNASPDSASHWLHDQVKPGSLLRALPPAGNFTLNSDPQRAVVLIGAGIGITPLLAMAQFLTGGTETRPRFPERRIYLIHAVRNSADHPFRAEVLARSQTKANLLPIFVYSAPGQSDIANRTAHVFGRLDRTALRAILPLDDYDIYLCGPATFMQAIYDALLSLGVADARIHAEAFGPASLNRRPILPSAPANIAPAPVHGATIHFATSGRQVEWTGEKSLLELAETQGIEAPFGCRSGHCGSCAVDLLAGRAGHAGEGVAPPDGQVLTCCAYPAEGEITLAL